MYAARFLATFYVFGAPYNFLTQAGIDLFKAYEDKCEAFLAGILIPLVTPMLRSSRFWTCLACCLANLSIVLLIWKVYKDPQLGF